MKLKLGVFFVVNFVEICTELAERIELKVFIAMNGRNSRERLLRRSFAAIFSWVSEDISTIFPPKIRFNSNFIENSETWFDGIIDRL